MIGGKNYTVLHCHTMLSNGVTNIDSVTKYTDYINKAVECDMKALAFSEHGSFFEYLHKKEACEKAGLKYIHAAEFYVTKSLEEKVRDNYHCLLIAKNYEGFKELNKLSSISFNREDGHFYFAPRITFDELINTSDNVIVSSACLGGIFASNDPALKFAFLQFYVANRERCFLEIAQHPSPQQVEYNKVLYDLSKKYNLQLIVGTDTHALNEEHADARLLLQRSKKVFFDNEGEFDMVWRTYDELVQMFNKQGVIPYEVILQALENTNKVADMVEPFELDRGFKYPRLYKESDKVLLEKINEGWKWRNIDSKPNSQKYKDEIEYELKAIRHNKSQDFFLLEEMYKSELRKRGVGYGYSRGSCSGSLICYLLGITHVDPVEWHLNFDRFMNLERISLADIDTDWFDTDRDKVRDLLYAKQGLYCSEIITFNTVALKGAFKDVARAFDMTPQEANEITSDIEVNEEKYRKQYPDIFRYVDLIQGTIVSIGTHPSACIVSPIPLDDNVGLCSVANNSRPVSQLNMKEIDSLNYVKLDILGLDCVGLINQTCDLLGVDRLLPENIDFNDKKVWDSIREDTTCIFQWESDSARSYLKQLFSDETVEKIKKFNPNFSYLDLMSVGNGAIRPAGSSYRDELAQGIYRDNGHEALNKLLAPTLGYLVYQCQIINFLHQFCGYTMGMADVVRRSFSKKLGTEQHIPQIKEGFIKTMFEKYGVDKKESERLIVNFIQVIEDASAYLFSENHALPYSMIGYAVGWLRYYYPLEFLTVAFNIYQTDKVKSQAITNYAIKQGFNILPPVFGKSKGSFWMDKSTNSIYKGIGSIKDMNNTIGDNLYEYAQNGMPQDFFDILVNVKELEINKTQLTKLIRIGYFNQFGTINELLIAKEIYNTYGTKKTLKKPCEFDVEGCFGKETEKQYSQLDNLALCRKIFAQHTIPTDSEYTLIQNQIEIMGYTMLTVPNAPMNCFALQGVEVNKYGTPFVKLYRLYDGGVIECKMDKKYFEEHPFNKDNSGKFMAGQIMKCAFKSKEKRKKVDGNWVLSGEFEYVLSAYVDVEEE